MPFIESLAWQPGRGSRVLVIDKDDLSQRREYELPPLFFFHLGDAWEEADSTIRFDGCFHKDPTFPILGASALVDGRHEHAERPELTLVTLRHDGRGPCPLGPRMAAIAGQFPKLRLLAIDLWADHPTLAAS